MNRLRRCLDMLIIPAVGIAGFLIFSLLAGCTPSATIFESKRASGMIIGYNGKKGLFFYDRATKSYVTEDLSVLWIRVSFEE